jgi:hypothetical protein
MGLAHVYRDWSDSSERSTAQPPGLLDWKPFEGFVSSDSRRTTLTIFDDAFVDANICSGLSVDAEQLQNPRELIVGAQGLGDRRGTFFNPRAEFFSLRGPSLSGTLTPVPLPRWQIAEKPCR